MGLLDSATTAVTSATSAVTTGLSNITSATGITDALSSAGSFLSNLYGSLSASSLPLKNILSSYATYDYIISLSPLTESQHNNSTYLSGEPLPLVCKTAGIDPNNRIQTPYGKFDFFIDNLTINGIIGMVSGKGTMPTTVSFNVYEPYSLGVFMLALEYAAAGAGWENWRAAPFLLKIEFRGNKENGQMENVLSSTRYYPIYLTTVQIKASEKGTTYEFGGFSTSSKAGSAQYSELKYDVAIKGKTVQEVLQTGEQSLQAIVNKRLKELVTKSVVAVADEVVILFPTDIAGSATIAGASESATTATINPHASGSSSIYKKLGLVEGTNKTQVQSEGDCNKLGKTSMGYDLSKRGDPAGSKENAVYQNDVWVRGNVTADPKEGTLRFAQKMDIPTVINQVMMLSDYPETALKATSTDSKTGMRPWWRIDTQVYIINTKANLKKTGDYPRIIVYRVVPYGTHISRVPSSGAKATGTQFLSDTSIKRYDYLYTGNNSEVLKFDLDFSIGFANILSADLGQKSQDSKLANQMADGAEKQTETVPLIPGPGPTGLAGENVSMVRYTGIESAGDRKGGGGAETDTTRIAKMWQQAITNPYDMMNLNLEIIGDPYWLAHSGSGTYTASPVPGLKDLSKDGSVSYQDSEVHTFVTFRSPLDINQATGLYTFGAMTQTAPVRGWSGLYTVNRVTSVFKQGTFRQTLMGFRIPNQEQKVESTPEQTVSTSNSVKPADEYANEPVAGGDGTWSA